MGPSLFFIYKNDLNKEIKYSDVHHFADDTNLLLSDKSLKKINKNINHDLKILNIWLRANKISLNPSKTEIILFRPKSQSNITKHLNFRISGQYIGRISEVKYLGLILNEFLSWSTYYTLLKKKLNQAIGLLSKVRHFTSQHLLKTLYYSLFNSHLIYGCQVWGQYQGTEFKKIETLQEKAIRIIKFLPNNAPVSKEMHKLRILKLKDFITLQNVLFVYDCLEEERMKSFNTTFKQMETNQFYNTRSFNTHQLKRRDFKTEKYGRFSILSKCLSDWNLLQNDLKTNF